MAKNNYNLETDFKFDFLLLAIVCHESEYRICSAINKCLGLSLERDEALELSGKKQLEALNFSVFTFIDQDSHIEYFLLNNLSSNEIFTEVKVKKTTQVGMFDTSNEKINKRKGRLIPENSDTDFFLLLKGDFTKKEKINLLLNLNKIDTIINFKEINPETLPSKNNLLF